MDQSLILMSRPFNELTIKFFLHKFNYLFLVHPPFLIFFNIESQYKFYYSFMTFIMQVSMHI